MKTGVRVGAEVGGSVGIGVGIGVGEGVSVGNSVGISVGERVGAAVAKYNEIRDFSENILKQSHLLHQAVQAVWLVWHTWYGSKMSSVTASKVLDHFARFRGCGRPEPGCAVLIQCLPY